MKTHRKEVYDSVEAIKAIFEIQSGPDRCKPHDSINKE